jgi:hypothetical protein
VQGARVLHVSVLQRASVLHVNVLRPAVLERRMGSARHMRNTRSRCCSGCRCRRASCGSRLRQSLKHLVRLASCLRCCVGPHSRAWRAQSVRRLHRSTVTSLRRVPCNGWSVPWKEYSWKTAEVPCDGLVEAHLERGSRGRQADGGSCGGANC